MPDQVAVTDRQKLKDYQHRIIVAGTRKWSNYKLFSACMDEYLLSLPLNEKSKAPPFIFITGDAKTGADALIIRYCKEFKKPWIAFTPNWNDIEAPNAVIKTRVNTFTGEVTKYNANAGFQRNNEMAEYGSRLVAFWDGKSPGTKHMAEAAKRRKISAMIYLINKDEEVGEEPATPKKGK